MPINFIIIIKKCIIQSFKKMVFGMLVKIPLLAMAEHLICEPIDLNSRHNLSTNFMIITNKFDKQIPNSIV